MGVQEPGLLVFDFSTGSKISLMTVYCHGDCIFPSLFLLLLLSLQRINAVIIVIHGGSIESNLKGENIKAENE